MSVVPNEYAAGWTISSNRQYFSSQPKCSRMTAFSSRCLSISNVVLRNESSTGLAAASVMSGASSRLSSSKTSVTSKVFIPSS